MNPETIQLIKFISEWAGSLGLFLGFALVSRRWVDPQSKIAIGLNLLGSAGFIVLNAIFHSWPPVVVNVFWFATGAFALIAKPKAVRSEVDDLKAENARLKDELKRLKAVND